MNHLHLDSRLGVLAYRGYVQKQGLQYKAYSMVFPLPATVARKLKIRLNLATKIMRQKYQFLREERFLWHFFALFKQLYMQYIFNLYNLIVCTLEHNRITVMFHIKWSLPPIFCNTINMYDRSHSLTHVHKQCIRCKRGFQIFME